MTTTPSSNQMTQVSNPVGVKPTRHTQLRKLLSRKSGASIAQIQKAFDWQPHTAWAAISTQRKTGCVIIRTDTDKGPVYRIVEEGRTQ